MYLNYYHLREYPFTLASDPRFLYFSPAHKDAMAGLRYGLRERKGLALLLGEPGTGKTTLLAAVLEQLPGGVTARALDSPLHDTPAEALEAVLASFGLQAEGPGLSARLARLELFLRTCYQRGECVLLIIDEAQDLKPMVLEQVRLLTNLEDGGHKLLQIILSGQPELASHLRLSNGRALHQRVAVRCELQPLSAAETQAYVAARLEHAGSQTPLFAPEAIARLHQWSRGVPRVINVIADHSLLAGFSAQQQTISAALVERAARQLDLVPPPAPAPLPVAAAMIPVEAAAPALAPGERTPPRPPALQRFATGWARWAGLTEGSK